jgi:predicted amidohydrolase
VAFYRRIGTTSFLYRDRREENGRDKERDAVIRAIGEAGRLKIDILLFQEEYSFWSTDVEEAPSRGLFAPARVTQGEHRASVPQVEPSLAELAIASDDPYIGRVRDAAQAAHVNVALPIVEREGSRLYNSILPVTDKGGLLRPYRKMFPVPDGELSAGIVPGASNEAQTIAGVPVSFAICFDVHFDEVFTRARRSGARLVLWSSMWMGGAWLRAQALRNGLYIVSAAPDGCTFVDIDGGLIAESPSLWPQTIGHNTIVYEDLNFDREVMHCNARGALNEIVRRYGPRVHVRNQPQDSIVIIESLDPALRIEEVMREFGLKSWFQYIEESRQAAVRAQGG